MPCPSSFTSCSQGQTDLWLSTTIYLSYYTCLTFVLRQVSLVNGLFDLVVGSFGIQIHGPAEVHQSQVGLTQFLIHLRQWDRHAAVRQTGRGIYIPNLSEVMWCPLPFLWESKPETLWERSASTPPTPEVLPADIQVTEIVISSANTEGQRSHHIYWHQQML